MRENMHYQKLSKIIKGFIMLKLHTFTSLFFNYFYLFKRYHLRRKMQQKRKRIYRNLQQERNKYLKRYLMLAQSIRRF